MSVSLTHPHYGVFEEKPHASLELPYSQWSEVEHVLEYDIGPPIAWKYEEGTLFLWGGNLDRDLIWNIIDGVNKKEQEYAQSGYYQAAQDTELAASRLTRATVVSGADE